MKVIIEIDDDLVQAQVTALTPRASDRKNREQMKAYIKDHDSVTISEEQLAAIDETFPAVLAVAAIMVIAQELDI